MDIKNNIKEFKDKLSNTNCQLVAVSKTKPVSLLQEAYDAGQRIFGENKVQEMTEKHPQLPEDIEWHMIGHLQRNKVKYIAPFVSLIHSIDSKRLLAEVNKQGVKNDRVINVLLQVHIAQEDTKFGFDRAELLALLHDIELPSFDHIKVVGLMGMATFTENKEQVQQEFNMLKSIYDEISGEETPENVEMRELSMGMSGDYEIAIEEGSTLIRVGSAIFGARNII